jgi:cation-transporting ATPase 13A3/4/5
VAIEPIFKKYYGGSIDSVFSPEQMEKPEAGEDDDVYNNTVVCVLAVWSR